MCVQFSEWLKFPKQRKIIRKRKEKKKKKVNKKREEKKGGIVCAHCGGIRYWHENDGLAETKGDKNVEPDTYSGDR